MFKKIIPLLIVCFSVGIIAGCSSSDPLISDAESNIQNKNYEAALTAAEKSIQQNPQNPLGYYYKGVALAQKGQAQDSPTESTQYYEQMEEALNKAKEMASSVEEPPTEIDRIDAIKNTVWRTEYNKAVTLATEDSVMQATKNPLQKSVDHLKNATMIQPDSSTSWEVLAQVNNMKKDYGQAAEAQEKFIELKDDPGAEAYIVLAQYYQLSDQLQESIRVLKNARKEYPKNIQVVEVLADAYSQSEQSEKAIGIVEELVDQDPTNPQYRLSLGTQIYQSAIEIQNSYDENINNIFDLRQKLKNASGSEAENINQRIENLQQENNELEKEINALTEQAVTELNAVLENRPDDPVAYNTLGIIYQNKAAVIFDKRNMTRDNAKAAKLDKQAKDLLRKSMTNYEKAAELDPENPEYWKSLFQIYTTLGMDEKAAEAEKKAGMQ
jgi:tetratricopeptide (TPR) repeat protein